MGPCPGLTGELRARVYEQLADTGVRIVSFSIDPRFDDPRTLAEYAARFTVAGERWLFLTGDEDEVRDFVRDGLKMAVAFDPEVEDPGRAITHSTRLPVIDPEGRIAGWYECALGAPEDVEAGLTRLVARARALDGRGVVDSVLPAVNASLNALAALLLVAGLLAIKGGARARHEHLMKAAFAVSAAFLACYLYYHFAVVPLAGGPTRYAADGWRKALYLVLLGSHTVLAAVNLPMVLRTLFLAHRQDWERHKRWARWTFPVWLYVSVTGVLVYVVLYHLNPAA
jgi:protein SCO1/2/putative membrane protein